MFPIGDEKLKDAPTAWVTILLIIANVLAFIYELSMSPQELEQFFMEYAVVPEGVMRGEKLHTLFTSLFLHGGWLHLIGNMLFLWVFGDNCENVMGHFKFLGFYLLGGLAATAAHIWFDPAGTVPTLGASGAISACLGAYLVMFPTHKVRMLIFLGFFITTIRVPAFLFLGFWIILQVFSGVAEIGAEGGQGGVAWWAHIGGFAFGILGGILSLGAAKKYK